ncbi:hypothetical protein MTO96_039059 [Rhipicephalus appendiculatus]
MKNTLTRSCLHRVNQSFDAQLKRLRDSRRHHDKPFQPASPIVFALSAHPGPETPGRHYPPPREPGAQHLTSPHTWNRQIPYTTEEPRRTGQSALQQTHEQAATAILSPRAPSPSHLQAAEPAHDNTQPPTPHLSQECVDSVDKGMAASNISLVIPESHGFPSSPSALSISCSESSAEETGTQVSPEAAGSEGRLPTKFPLTPLPPQTTRGPLRVLRVVPQPPPQLQGNVTKAPLTTSAAPPHRAATSSPGATKAAAAFPRNPGMPPSLQPQQNICPHRERQVLASSSQNRQTRAQGRENSPLLQYTSFSVTSLHRRPHRRPPLAPLFALRLLTLLRAAHHKRKRNQTAPNSRRPRTRQCHAPRRRGPPAPTTEGPAETASLPPKE